MNIPDRVAAAQAAARDAGFELSCDPRVGELLSVLSAAVRHGGSILELGTGAGVGLAWIVAGLGDRTDVSVTSVEIDPQLVRVAASLDLPDYVDVLVADGVDLLSAESRWSLIFADAPAGKWDGLDQTIAALDPGGILLVDDMTPPEFVSDLHRNKTIEARETLLSDARLRSVEIDWASGLIMCARTS